MFTEDKVTEIFFMADEFCGFFDSRMEKYALRDHKKRIYHRESTMSKSQTLLSKRFRESAKTCQHSRLLQPSSNPQS